ncbi:MAG: hypothetical protein KAU62_10050 [Candidatus Heimdallarchaeota archaeon]|nr:hypothetical protein [Candidatus Heimdallarchaeota archaeon]MCG3256419.1 hypothetical protein [Candidatus Heimdallarchaeota archaeon]MCK4611485.1 hypothetical protein [Candidatus Heimdallarchaeota archaeon]
MELEASKNEQLTINRLRFLETTSIQYSYIIMFVIGGLVLISGIILSQLDLSGEAAGKIFYPITSIERFLIKIMYFGVIFFLSLNFVKVSKWSEWEEPVPIARNITKISAVFSSTCLFIMNIVYYIYYDIFNFEYMISIGGDYDAWRRGHMIAGALGLVILVFLCLLIVSLFAGIIVELIHNRNVRRIDYRPAILAIAIVIVYTFMFYGGRISGRLTYTWGWNVGLFVSRLVHATLFFINGTIFLLLDMKQKKK